MMCCTSLQSADQGGIATEVCEFVHKVQPSKSCVTSMYVYIYIYREREIYRYTDIQIHMYTYIYVYIYIYVFVPPP